MRSIRTRAGTLSLLLLASLFVSLAGPLSSVAAAQDDEELEELLAEERQEADRLRRLLQ